uniref:Ig-like domain-containing protein n=1 Tax=Anguilla anguilla TaxID=7936 RepID=A0A0E9X504_ANGAN
MKTVTWMFLIIPLIFASQETLYLKKLEGESALFVCASEETGSHPIGLYLKRECTGPEREVMFFSESGPEGKPEDKERIQVLGDLSTIPVNVTISQLERRDSGLYFCEFVYAGESEDRVIRGKEEFFLFVDTVKIHEGLRCGCQNYPPLLYAISAAVGLLLLILLGLAASRCGKQCKRSKPQKPAPIYEEMNARQPAKRKSPPSPPGPRVSGGSRRLRVHQPSNQAPAGKPLREPPGKTAGFGSRCHRNGGQPVKSDRGPFRLPK